MIELAVLWLLKEQQLHGYELKKRSRELLGPLARVSYGSLYPALARLERDGAVAAVDEAPPAVPIPMTGSLAGEAAAFRATRRRVGRTARPRRGRKVYGITAAGERRLAELLGAADEDDRTFTVQLAFARHLATEARAALLEARRRHLAARLAEAQRGLEAGTARLDTYLRSIREHEVESTRHDLDWIDRLLAAEPTPGARETATSAPRPEPSRRTTP